MMGLRKLLQSRGRGAAGSGWDAFLALMQSAMLALLLLLAAPAQAQSNANFDHASTGFVLDAQHQDVPCESCHVNGRFQGTPRDCASCHGKINPIASTFIPSTHFPTTLPCETCHTSNLAQFSSAVFTHATVTNNQCSTCHNGAFSPVAGPPADTTHKSATATGLGCGTCHSTLVFAQNAVPTNHIPYSPTAVCASCHTDSSFATMPTLANIHANAPSSSSNCQQCHSSSAAAAFAMATMVPPIVAPPSSHIGLLGQSCEACHVGSGSSLNLPVGNGAKFTHSLFNHGNVSTGCVTCHGPGVSASNFYGITSIVTMPSTNGPSSSAHIPSSTTCETCHLGDLGNVTGQIAPIASSTVPGTKFQLPAPTKAQIHAGVTSGCAACHDTNAVWLNMNLSQYALNTSNNTGFQTRPQPSSAGTFFVADAGHATVGECSNCHIGISFDPNAALKPANHIPTASGSTCQSCHVDPNYSVMPSITAIHANAPSTTANCAACHSAANAARYAMATMVPAIVAPPSTHIDMGSAGCETCHVGTNSSVTTPVQSGAHFSSSGFSHTGIGQTCAYCHAAGAGPFYGVSPKSPAGLTPPHVAFPSTVGCDTCHTNSIPSALIPQSGGSSTTFANGHFIHTGATSGCVTCHGPSVGSNSFYGLANIVVMPPSVAPGLNSHIPSSTTCENCHSAPAGLVTTITPAPGSGFQNNPPNTTQIHAGVTGNCASCHESNFIWMGMSPAYTISTAAPYTGFQTRPSNTLATSIAGFFVQDPTGGHPNVGDCADCHGSFSDFTGVSKPLNHIPYAAGANCTACHTSTDYSVMPSLDAIHANAQSTTGNCAQCHSTSNAAYYAIPVAMPTVKAPPSNHVDMGTLGCEGCHVGSNSSLTLPVAAGALFSNSAFSHTGLVKQCSDCHGTTVTATSFYGVVTKTFNLSPPHVPTSLQCSTCHTPTPSGLIAVSGGTGANTFGNAKFIHTGISSGCATCHDSTITSSSFYGLSNIVVMPPAVASLGGPTNHIPVGNTCENCHSAPAGFVTSIGTATLNAFFNSPPGTVSVHAGISGNCSSCHERGTTWIGMTAYARTTTGPSYTGFQTRPINNASGSTVGFYVQDPWNVHPDAGDCGSCHGSINDFAGVSKPANHIPVSAAGNADCTKCHNIADYSQLPARSAIHTWAPSSTNNCVQCHSASNAAIYAIPAINFAITAPATNHIDMAGLSCESCHLASLPVGDTTTFAGSSFSHTGVTTNCANCHDASVTVGTFQGTGFVPKTNNLSPAPHVPIMTALGCDACHVNDIPSTPIPASGATGSMKTFAGGQFSHSGLTWGCVNCHGPSITSSSFAGISGIVVMPPSVSSGGGSQYHMPAATTCEDCHSASIPSALVPANTLHAAPGSQFANNLPNTTQVHNGITANCSSCHEHGTTWMSLAPTYNISTAAPYTGFQTRPSQTLATNVASFFVNDPIHPNGGDCSNCHGSFSDFSLPSMPANHIPVSAAGSANCALCHTTNYAQLPSMQAIHANAASGATCAQCHSATNAAFYSMATQTVVGPPTGHMDMGTQDCAACHVATGSDVSLPVGNGGSTPHFTHSGFSHTGFTGNCGECHGSINATTGVGTSVSFSSTTPATSTPVTIVSAQGLSPAHVPTGLSCEVCHSAIPSAVIPYGTTSLVTFAGAKYSHSDASPPACETCHGSSVSGASFYGLSNLVYLSSYSNSSGTNMHIPLPATYACSTCHQAPSSTVPTPTAPLSGRLGLTQFLTPVPTTGQIHTGISTGCATCHESPYTWLDVSQYPRNNTSYVAGNTYTGFYTRPGNPANGPNSILDTAPPSGHPSGGDCSNCHVSTNDFNVSAMPSNHIPVSAAGSTDCTKCHSTDYSQMPSLANIHAYAPSTTGNCAQCHSAANAVTYNMSTMVPALKGPPTGHMDMGTLDCVSCHVASGSDVSLPVGNGGTTPHFTHSGFSHTGFTTNCGECHGSTNNTSAGGGAATTLPTTGFSTQLTSIKSVSGLSRPHVPTALSCEACHAAIPTVTLGYGATSAVTFANGKFSHSDPAPLACDVCHGNAVASYYGLTNLVVLSSYTNTQGTANHIPLPSTYVCSTCHQAPTTPVAMPAAAQSARTALTQFLTPVPSTTQIHTGITGNCAQCHESGSQWLDVTPTYFPRTSTFTPGGTYTGFQTRPLQTASALSPYSIVNTSAYVHPTTGDCSSCHGSTADFSITAKPANHIPVQSVNCILCHTSMGTNNDFSTNAGHAAIHLYAPTPGSNCAQCHSAANAPTFALPAIGFTVKAPSANHVPLLGSTACETCHVGGASSVPASGVVSDTALFDGNQYSHSGITTGCATCHAVGGSSLYPFTSIPAVVQIPASSTTAGPTNHIPYGTLACETCHIGMAPSGVVALPGAVSVTSGNTGFKMPISSASNAAVHSTGTAACLTCHEKNLTWLGISQATYNGSPLTTGQTSYTGFLTRPFGSAGTYPNNSIVDANHAAGTLATADCSQCHGSTTAFSAAAQPAGHMPIVAGTSCAVCHTGTAGDYSVAGMASALSNTTTLHPGIAVSATLVKLTSVAAVSSTSCVTCHTVGTGGTSGKAPFAGCAVQSTNCGPPPPTGYYQPTTTTGATASSGKTGTTGVVHVPIGTLDCSACHVSESTFASTTMGSTGHSNAKTGGDKCMSCHENGMAWTNVTSSFQVRPPLVATTPGGKTHTGSKAAPNDCAGCHSYGSNFRGLVRPVMRSAAVGSELNRVRPTGQGDLTTRGALGNSYDHQGVIAGQCKTCHDGRRASGMPGRHLMVQQSCDTCHRTTTWSPAQFSHNGISANTCLSCHNGLSASARPVGHFMSGRSCDNCHKTMAWEPVSYSHLSPAYQASAAANTCVSCHTTNSEIIPRQMRSLTRSKPIPVGN